MEEKKKHLKLTARQKEILIGTLLGDGHLETQNNRKTYRLKIEHSLKQMLYVEWFANEFQEWIHTPPKKRSRMVTLHGKIASYDRIGFATLSSGAFRFFAQQFYPSNGINKVVPKLIHRWLSPLALAVWFMDDGSIKSNRHRTVFLNTHGFSDADLERLQEALKQNYGIQTSIRVQKDGKQIYLLAETINTFLTLIEPYVIPSMRYKLPKVWLTQLPKM